LVIKLPVGQQDYPDSEGRLKEVNVFVYTETCILNGYTYCMSQQRLLDTLNQKVVANYMTVGKDFLPLTQVKVLFVNGDKQTRAEANVRKSNILFVGENSDALAAIPETTDRQLVYHSKLKTALAAEIHLPSYVLRGQIYGKSWQQILDIVDRADKFIALTDVQVGRTSDKATSKFDFVAVNRNRIIYIGEPANSAESTSIEDGSATKPGGPG